MESTLARDRWLPKSVLCLRDYSLNKFLHDLLAGITVGLVALPLAMAFAIASGLTPQAGIYCAVVTGFLISALGGSTTQIGGPTGAFVVVIDGIDAVHGVEGLFMCTVMAGVILVIMGLAGMGAADEGGHDHRGLHQIIALQAFVDAQGGIDTDIAVGVRADLPTGEMRFAAICVQLFLGHHQDAVVVGTPLVRDREARGALGNRTVTNQLHGADANPFVA